MTQYSPFASRNVTCSRGTSKIIEDDTIFHTNPSTLRRVCAGSRTAPVASSTSLSWLSRLHSIHLIRQYYLGSVGLEAIECANLQAQFRVHCCSQNTTFLCGPALPLCAHPTPRTQRFYPFGSGICPVDHQYNTRTNNRYQRSPPHPVESRTLHRHIDGTDHHRKDEQKQYENVLWHQFKQSESFNHIVHRI